ncbi:MAG: hypothetical protein ABSA79_09470 [Candidatus Bathyarchaeia archaeon]
MAILLCVASFVILRFVTGFDILDSYVIIIVIFLVSLAFLEVQVGVFQRLKNRLALLRTEKIALYGIIIFLIVWLSFLIDWFRNYVALASAVNAINAVPTEIYPVRLGIVGLLSIFACIILLKERSQNLLFVFIIIVFVSIFVGRFLTFFTIYVNYIPYWETRVIPFTFSVMAIIAPIPIIKGFSIIRNKLSSKRLLKIVTCALLVFLIVLSGMTSTFLALQQQKLSKPVGQLDETQASVVNYLNSKSTLYPIIMVGPTSRSSILGLYIPTIWSPLFSNLMWAGSPEFVTNALASPNSWGVSPEYKALGLANSSTQLILSSQELAILENNFPQGFLSSYITRFTNTSYENNDITVFKIPYLSPTSSNSKTVLVLPDETSKNDSLYNLYAMLSLENLNYSTALLSDINTIRNATTLIVTSETVAQYLINNRNNYDLSFQSLLVFNIDGYSNIASKLFNIDVSSEQDQTAVDVQYINCSSRTIGLPSNIEVLPLNTTADVLATYDSVAPLIIKQESTLFTMYYYNIYPLFNGIENSSARDNFALLSEIPLYAVETNPQISSNINYQLDFVAFNESRISGSIKITGASAIANYSHATINSDGKVLDIKDAGEIIPVSSTDFETTSASCDISGYESFYTNVSANNVTVTYHGTPAIVTIRSEDGSEMELQGSSISIHSDQMQLLIREAVVTADGKGTIYYLNGYGPNLLLPREFSGSVLSGDTYTFEGHIDLAFSFGGNYAILKYLRIQGNFNDTALLYGVNEIQTAERIVDILIVIAIICLAFTLIRKYHNNKAKLGFIETKSSKRVPPEGHVGK